MPVSNTVTPTITIPRANAGLGVLAMVAIAVSTIALLKPQADASAVARAPATPVATIDLVSVITQLKEFEDMEDRIKAEGEKKTAEIDRLTEEIEGLQEDLKPLDPNSDAYDQTFRELNMKAGFRELRGTMLIRWQAEDNARVLTELYEKALDAVETVAKRDGWGDRHPRGPEPDRAAQSQRPGRGGDGLCGELHPNPPSHLFRRVGGHLQ